MRVVVATAILGLAPRAALACSACALAGISDNAAAYVSMSLVLTALPLGMVLGVATWLYRNIRRADRHATGSISS
ncbi:MAG: hypothetical protein A3I61_08635 [Acidobacteria bacterium RIFCSPLOWO2_02_FULL_68_18]|nr:MAG: hypothetical protein A3I61_08635 [Acidobacteria bacterium RIFCSPLOWO2_02_FULL_68_18]OFW49820.1 MAG: hypothetical protein A3G77_01350 [Acidobacteria bacterium RIFCSPLOWO2_12_FULL_68_19]